MTGQLYTSVVKLFAICAVIVSRCLGTLVLLEDKFPLNCNPTKPDASCSNSCYLNACYANAETCCGCLGVAPNYQECDCCPGGYRCCVTNETRPINSTHDKPVTTCCPLGSACHNDMCIDCNVLKATPAVEKRVNCQDLDIEISLGICVDDAITALYVDGVLIPNSSLPHRGEYNIADFVPIPGNSSVIAVYGTNSQGGYAYLIASSNDSRLYTDTDWKCLGVDPNKLPTDWMKPNFDDASWPYAFNASHPVPIAGISPRAKYIWTKNSGIVVSNPNADKFVLCRGKFHNNPSMKNKMFGDGCKNCSGEQCCDCFDQPHLGTLCSCCPKGTFSCRVPGGNACCPDGWKCTTDGRCVGPLFRQIPSNDTLDKCDYIGPHGDESQLKIIKNV